MTDNCVMPRSGASQADRVHASRARLASAADAERRAIEAALHDGVQQDLVLLGVRLQLVRQLAETDPPAMLAVLDEVVRDVHAAIERLRGIADRVYPSLLSVRGLAEALRALAPVEASGVGRYPAEFEAALYFACRDALGEGSRVLLREDEGVLRLEVFGPDRDGLGLARDRIEALGGDVAANGSRLVASVPLYGPDSAR